jgi:hypothetical protein
VESVALRVAGALVNATFAADVTPQQQLAAVLELLRTAPLRHR